jgi:hypothetical protein
MNAKRMSPPTPLIAFNRPPSLTMTLPGLPDLTGNFAINNNRSWHFDPGEREWG